MGHISRCHCLLSTPKHPALTSFTTSLLNLPSSAIICPQTTFLACKESCFPLKKDLCLAFRPSQGLTHLDGWMLQYHVCSFLMQDTDGPGSPRAALCQSPMAVTAGCHPSEVSRSIQPPPWAALGLEWAKIATTAVEQHQCCSLDMCWMCSVMQTLPCVLGGPVLTKNASAEMTKRGTLSLKSL